MENFLKEKIERSDSLSPILYLSFQTANEFDPCSHDKNVYPEWSVSLLRWLMDI